MYTGHRVTSVTSVQHSARSGNLVPGVHLGRRGVLHHPRLARPQLTPGHRLDAPHVLRDAPHERLQVGPRVVVPQVGERLDVQLVVGLGKSV